MVTLRFLWAWSLVSLCAACGSTDNNHTAAAGGTDPEGASGSSSAGTAGKANAAGANTGGAANTGGGSNLGGNANAGSAGKSTAGAAGGNSVSEGPGTITATWEGYCVATFTEDYLAKDPFGAPLFTALKGEQYLVIYYPEPPFSAKIAYLTSTGPYSVDVAPNAAQTGFPFTTQCPVDEGVSGSYFAVFADVSVYAEPALTNKLCDLKAGTGLPRVMNAKGAGYSLESLSADSAIYEIFLNAFSPQCGNADSGYVSVPVIQLFGSQHVVVPFQVISAPP